MTPFKEICFTPAEFSKLAKIDKQLFSELENDGLIQTFRKKVGNVDRKMITLEEVQNYFRVLRTLSEEDLRQSISSPQGEGAVSAGEPLPIEVLEGALDSQAQAEPQPVAALQLNTRPIAEHPMIRAMNAISKNPPVHKTQMFYNVKGGTGKSTLTAQYVMRAAMMGYKVLAIDLDGQGHLTVNLDVLNAHELPTIYDVLINDLPLKDAIVNVAPCLDLVPANLGLCNIEIPLNQKPRREYRLGEAILSILDQYDIIVADTNPAASILNSSMLVAADKVNVVCATNPLSFHGMSLVMATIEGMQKEFRRKLEVKVIPNMYDNREVISQEVLGELRAQFPDFCARSVINRSADLNEATKRRTTVWDVNPKGTASEDIATLTEELIHS